MGIATTVGANAVEASDPDDGRPGGGTATEDGTFGVAIRLPAEPTQWLYEKRRSYGDPLADVVHPHITLVPPFTADRSRAADIAGHLGEVAAASRPFRVRLSGAETFRPVSPVVYLAVVEGGPECAALAEACRRGPIDRPLAFPYHPHVTLAHGVTEDQLDRALAENADFDLSFDVTGLALFSQGAGGRWSNLGSFALGGDAQAGPHA